MLSLLDQLFGTATFQNSYPKEYGLQQKTNDPWTASYFYPFVKSPDLNSEWSAGFKKIDTRSLQAISVSLTKGELYLWCACGMIKNKSFCDGSHHENKFKSQKFTLKRTGTIRLCNCKKSNGIPFCDDTHLSL